MTYRATRYARTPGRMHGCPDAYRNYMGEPSHFLVLEPGQDDPSQFVCPVELDQERAEAAEEARHAERVAAGAEAIRALNRRLFDRDGHGYRASPEDLAAAVLDALAESGGA